MYLPRVIVLYSNGNLLKDIDAIDGIAGIVQTVQTVGLIGVPKVVYNLLDAETQGFTADDEPDMHRQIREFYDEVGGNQELWVMGTADTMAMSGALDYQDEESAKKLIRVSNGKVRLLGVCRIPDEGYDAGNAFYDADLEGAILKANTFCQGMLNDLVPLRVLIEGRVANEDSLDILEPKSVSVGSAGVVVGGSANDGSASVGTALGRAVKYGAQIKIGKVANGPLSISQVYIGSKLLKDVQNLDTLHGTAVISFMNHPGKAGFYFGIDRMASTDDYRLLAYGRTVDKAAIIAAATYLEQLESEVEVDDSGNIAELEIKHLEKMLEQQVNANMANQISGISIYINPAQDIINTGQLLIKVRVRPLGYTSYITVDLGLTAGTA